MKNIVVTGGSSGVGESVVKGLIEKGHRLWNLDVQKQKHDSLSCQQIPCDLSDVDSIDTAIQQLPDRVDVLANIAGIAESNVPEKVVAVNFLGPRHLTESLKDRMAKGSHIINVSSIAGRDWKEKYDSLLPLLDTQTMNEGMALLQENPKIMGRSSYTLSKRCLTAYTLRSAQASLSMGITINNVSPGPVATPLYPKFETLLGQDQSEWMIAQTGRQASPTDIAQAIEMLCLTECSWLNGVDIPVDGGFTAGMESGWIDFEKSPAMEAYRASQLHS